MLAARDFAGGGRAHRHGRGSGGSRRLGWCRGRSRSRSTDWFRGIDANTQWTRLVDEEVRVEIRVAVGAQPGIPRRQLSSGDGVVTFDVSAHVFYRTLS